MRFRKKPVVIEAVQFVSIVRKDNGDSAAQFATKDPPAWLGEAYAKGGVDRSVPGALWAEGDGLCIMTLEGTHLASPGDWIIQGIKGELYPCKPDVFTATYEAIE